MTSSDWDNRIGGWRCEALTLPGAKLAKIYMAGGDANDRAYSVQGNVIIWNKPDLPVEIVAFINLEKELSQLEAQKTALEDSRNSLEREKLDLEREKFKSDRRWKILSAAGAICSAVLSFVFTQTLRDPQPSKSEAAAAQKIYQKSNDFLSSGKAETFSQFFKGAKREVWFVGTSFYISVDNYRDEMLEKARSGVNLYFLILDPAGQALPRAALALDMSEESVIEQCITGIRSLTSMSDLLQKSGSSGRLFVRLSSEFLTARLYFFDPRQSDGATYYVPQINFVSSQALPGFLVRNQAASFHALYFQGVSKLWNSDRVVDLEEWRKRHPGYGIK